MSRRAPGLLLLALACGGGEDPVLGLVEGQLRPCPDSPNCVLSQGAPQGEQRIDPLPLRGPPEAEWAALRALIENIDDTIILNESPGYLHARCTTALLRFDDDLELLLDAEAGVVHLRSASRVGHSDLGANRRRVEALRARWMARP